MSYQQEAVFEQQGFKLGVTGMRKMELQERQRQNLSMNGNYAIAPYREDGLRYHVIFENTRDVACEIEFFHQDVYVDTYFLRPYQRSVLTCPGEHQRGQFTLFPDGSSGAAYSGEHDISDEYRGVLRAIFWPDTSHITKVQSVYSKSPYIQYSTSGDDDIVFEGFRSMTGTTSGLTGYSNQQFSTTYERVRRTESIRIALRMIMEKQYQQHFPCVQRVVSQSGWNIPKPIR